MASPPSDIPNELLAQVFEQLGIQDLYKCHLVCKKWRVVACEDSVLRKLCWRLGYLPPGALPQDLMTPRRGAAADGSALSDGHRHSAFRLDGRDAADAASLQELVKRSRILRKIKCPQPPRSVDFGPALPELQGVVTGYANNDDEFRSDIWRFKVDPVDNVMITTSRRGPLTTVDLNDGHELWRDPHGKSYAHLEHDEGWVVHDTNGRGAQGHSAHFQIRKFERLVDGQENPRRGVLVPAGTISCPAEPNAFRLRWPHLAVATRQDIIIYDITTCEIVERFAHKGLKSASWSIRYIEMDDEFIFLLSGPCEQPANAMMEQRAGLRVYERWSQGRAVLEEINSDLCCAASWTIQSRALGELHYGGQPMRECPTLGIAVRLERNKTPEQSYAESTAWADAVHPDQQTGSLVLSGGGLLLIIPDYKKALKNSRKDGHRSLDCIGVMSESDGAPPGRNSLLAALYRRQNDPDRASSYLAVADGIAAFIPVHPAQPTWLDLRTLIRATHNPAVVPRAATFCLGQALLEDCSSFLFYNSSCVQMDATHIYAVASVIHEAGLGIREDVNPHHTMVFTMRFDQILEAKLKQPDLYVDKEPFKTIVAFPRRDAATKIKVAEWSNCHNKCSRAIVKLPNCRVELWPGWITQQEWAVEGGVVVNNDAQLHWFGARSPDLSNEDQRNAAKGLSEPVDDEMDGMAWSDFKEGNRDGAAAEGGQGDGERVA